MAVAGKERYDSEDDADYNQQTALRKQFLQRFARMKRLRSQYNVKVTLQ